MPVGQGGRDRLDGPEEARLLADETANGAGDAHEFAMQRLSAVFTGIPPRPLVYENAPKPLMGAATSKPPQITTNALDADVPIIPPIVLLLLLTCCALLAKFVHRFRFLPPYLSSRLGALHHVRTDAWNQPANRVLPGTRSDAYGWEWRCIHSYRRRGHDWRVCVHEEPILLLAHLYPDANAGHSL